MSTQTTTVSTPVQTTTTVWLSMFDPMDASYSSVGGFDWDYVKANAEAYYDAHLAAHGAHDRVRLYEVDEVPVGLSNQEVTDWLDESFVNGDHSEDEALRDNHRYSITDVEHGPGARGEDYITFNVQRPEQAGYDEEEPVEFIVHQSMRDRPTINVEIGGMFDADNYPGVGGMVVHLNDSVVYTTDPELLTALERDDLRLVLTELLNRL